MFLELRAIVCEDMLEWHGEDHLTEAEELLRSLRCMRCRAPGEPKATVQILEGNDVSPAAVDEALHGIECDAVARVRGFEILGLPQDLLTIGPLHRPEMIELLREDPESTEIVDESADRGGGGNGQCIPATVSFQENLQLLLSEIGMCHPESLDLF